MPEIQAPTTASGQVRSRRVALAALCLLAFAILGRMAYSRLSTYGIASDAAGETPPAGDAAAELPVSPPPLPVPHPAEWKHKRDFLLRLPPMLSAGDAIDSAQRAREIGDESAARAILKEAMPRYPSDYLLKIALADTDRGLMRIDEARALYLKANRQDPDRMESYVGLANLDLAVGKHEEAWEWMRLAARTADERAPAEESYLALAQAYRGMNGGRQAEQALRRAVDVAPGDISAQLQLASMLLDFGRVKESSALLESVFRRQPSDARTCRLLGASLASPGSDHPDFARARLLLEKALDLNPRDIDAYRALGPIYEHEHLFRLAAQMYDSVLRLDPESVDARYELGGVYRRFGKTELSRQQIAISELRRQAERELDSLSVAALSDLRRPESHFALAIWSEAHGRFADAVRGYQVCASLDSRNARYRDALRDLYRKLGWKQ